MGFAALGFAAATLALAGAPAAVSAAPAITSVTIVSKPRLDANNDGTNETYGAGQNIVVDVTWDQAVTWDVSATNAGVAVRVQIGDNERRADLVTGGATSGAAATLRFRYAVVAADTDTDGVAVVQNAQQRLVRLRSGATLKSAADGTVDALVTHAGLGAQSGHLVNGASSAPANRAPTYDNDGDPATDNTNHGPMNAPENTLVHRSVSMQREASSGMPEISGAGFADPDGDPLTFTFGGRLDAFVSNTPRLVGDRYFLRAAFHCQFANLSPPIVAANPDASGDGNAHIPVTLTASDPDGASVQIRFTAVSGIAKCPEFDSATVNGATLKVVFDRDINRYGLPGADAVTVKVDGTAASLAGNNPVSRSGKTLTLTLASPVTARQTVTVSYTPGDDALTTGTWADAPIAVAFADRTVTNLSGPTFSSAAVNGTTLAITFDAALSGAAGHIPAPGQFDVQVAGSRVNVASGGVSISGTAVTLTLESAVTAGQTVTVAYTKPATGNKLQAANGDEAATFAAQSVTNRTGPVFSSATVDGTMLAIAFDAALSGAAGHVPAPGQFDVQVAGSRVNLASGGVSISGAAVTLALESAVKAGQAVTVAYTRPATGNKLQSASGGEVATFAAQSVTNNTASAFSSATVDGTTLAIAFDAALSGAASHVPAPGRFDVQVAGSRVNVISGGVSIAGTAVTLTLESAVTAGQTVTVAYTKPANGNKLQDASGREVATFAAQSVTNDTPNTAPTVPNEIPDQSATVNAAFSYQFPANTFSDDDGHALTYTATKGDGTALPTWLTFAAGTRTFSGTPTAAGTISIKVTADDGTDSVSDTFDIVVITTIAPTAQAGADRTVNPGETVTLSGSGTDSDGTIQSYAWSQISGTSVTLQNANTAQASFTAPDTAGPLVFRLTVTDNLGATGSDDVTVTVNDVPPVFAGGVQTLRLKPGEAMTPVVLPAATGGNGGPYSYALASAPAGLAGLSFDAATRTLSGTPDTEKGRWTFTYTAHDDDDNTADSDAARLSFQVTVGLAPEVRRRAVKRTVAAVASRTVAGAVANIGTRLGDAVPGASLTIAGETVPLDAASGASGTAAGWRDGAACRAAGFGQRGFGAGGGFGSGFGAGACAGLRSRGVDADSVLPTSAFSLVLGAAPGDKGFDPKAALWSVWGRGDLGYFAGRPEPGMRYRGETRTGWLGVDARGWIGGSKSSRRWIAGLAVSHGTSEADYSFEGGGDPSERGRLETALNALWPYGRWTFENGLELRGMAGAGVGSLRHVPGDGEPSEESELTMWTVSVGLKRKLPPVAGIRLAARGDASFVRMETRNGEQTIDGLRADSWRVRAGVEASRRFETEGGRTFTPFLEIAARQDGGDGLTGTGLEVAGGLRHSAPGVDIELRGRWLAAHTQEGTEERGVSLTVRMLPTDRGRGLSLSLRPRWGAGTGGGPGGSGALWREDMPKGAPGGGAAGRLESELGYGIPMFGDRFTGTPNLGFGLSGGGARDYRIGWRLTSAVRGDPGFRVDLDATRRETANDDEPAEHGATLQATVRF